MGQQSTPAIDAAMQRGVALHHAGRLVEAETLYRQVLAEDPDHPGALSSLAMVFHSARSFEAARDLLQRALVGDADNPGYWLNLGAVERELGHMDEAVAAHERAIALDPQYGDAYYNLCDLHLARGQPNAAVAVCDHRLALVDRDWRALAFKAHSLELVGDLEAADELLDVKRFRRRVEVAAPEGFRSLGEFNAALTRHILEHPTLVHEPPGRSTRRGRHTGELFKAPYGPMKPFERIVNRVVSRYAATMGEEDPDHPFVSATPPRWHLTAWALVLDSGGHEVAHIHPNGWLSGVYYVALPASVGEHGRDQQGWLEFGRPTADLTYPAEPRVHAVPPKVGSMYLFPSYLYHGTIPFESTEQRICIAFDVEPLYAKRRPGKKKGR